MLEDIIESQNESVIVLHACAHNPTGMDLSKDQWLKLAGIIRVTN